MPIRVQMPNGTVRPFREGTPKSVIRRAQQDMLADMKASGVYDGFDFSEFEDKPKRRVTVTQYGVPRIKPPRPVTPRELDRVENIQFNDPPVLRPTILGDLSMLEETSKRPGQDQAAAGRILSGKTSGGKDDPGGISYGAYQLASKTGTLEKFLASKEGQPWAGQFADVDMKEPGAAQSIWRAIAKTEGDDFFRAQHKFIERTHYAPAVANVRKATGIDLDNQSEGVRQAVWSVAVQHRKAGLILGDAVKSLEGQFDQADPVYQQELINAIYKRRREYWPADTDRYNREENEALNWPTGGQ